MEPKATMRGEPEYSLFSFSFTRLHKSLRGNKTLNVIFAVFGSQCRRKRGLSHLHLSLRFARRHAVSKSHSLPQQHLKQNPRHIIRPLKHAATICKLRSLRLVHDSESQRTEIGRAHV